MKQVLMALTLAAVSACGIANNGTTAHLSSSSQSLAGKAFCRSVVSNGGFGQPAGVREHCLTFVNKAQVIDNANTFFGNPPQTGTYLLQGLTLVTEFVSPAGEEEKHIYSLSSDGKKLTSLEGQVLTLTKATR